MRKVYITKIKPWIALLLLILLLLPAGCGRAASPDAAAPTEAAEPTDTAAPTDAGEVSVETAPPAPEPEEPYTFNHHLFSPLLSRYYSQEWWDSLYHLCDALREGRDTFACASREIYDWCMDEVTLAHLFPAACMAVSGKSSDGTTPYENGIGRIYYSIPPEEFIVREAEFETLVEDILNRVLEPDDTEFEKSFKLYAYMAAEYTYFDCLVEGEGFTYSALKSKQGVCEHLSSVYAYLLLQAGVDALSVGCFDSVDHAWTYMIVDGEGYYTDPTFALHEPGEPLTLTYFLNTEEERIEQGMVMDDLTAAMVPGYWLSYTETTLPAASEKYACLHGAEFVSLDEEQKILSYDDGLGIHAFRYE